LGIGRVGHREFDSVLLAWFAHLYTASGLLLAFLASLAVLQHDYRTAFFWLGLQIVVDATDGWLARAAQVSEKLPWFNGAKLDDIVDYLSYVFVPALVVWQAPLVPPMWRVLVPGAMLVSSGYGFNREDAKTADHFFTGFPSYWNIIVFYLMVAQWSRAFNAGLLLMLAALVFVPVRYIYPSRTPVWRLSTNLLGAGWGAAMLVMVWQYPSVSRVLFIASLSFPAYYVVLSLVVGAKSR
jgi:phosphatidylcholine synthase